MPISDLFQIRPGTSAALLALSLFLLFLFHLPTASAERSLRKQRGLKQTRSLDLGSSSSRSSLFLKKDLNPLEIYEPEYLHRLQRYKDKAQPFWDPQDIDPDAAKYAVSRAFLVQFATQFYSLLKKSEFGREVKRMRKKFRELRNTARVSVQSDGQNTFLSQKKEGEKLFEFKLYLDPKSIIEPQLVITDKLRVRQDLSENATMLEYHIDF